MKIDCQSHFFPKAYADMLLESNGFVKTTKKNVQRMRKLFNLCLTIALVSRLRIKGDTTHRVMAEVVRLRFVGAASGKVAFRGAHGDFGSSIFSNSVYAQSSSRPSSGAARRAPEPALLA